MSYQLSTTPRIDQIRQTTPPPTPLTPREIVSDDTLRMLARDTPDRTRGILSDTEQAILAMILPDICGELIARRAVMTP